MPEPTQIPASSLQLDASTNTPATETTASTAQAESSNNAPKLSLGEFENYIPSGIKPKVKDGKLVNPKGVELPTTTKQSTAAKDTNESLEKPEEVEDEVETEGEVAKEETEEGEEEPVAEEQTPEEKEASAKLHGNTKRDYTGFSDSQIKILKKLDNSRFATISSEWKVLKEAVNKSVELATELVSAKKMLKEGGIPQSWHEHPDAYQLSKEFQDISTQYSQQESLENHYERQLLAIRQGKPWTYVTGVDPKTGQLQLSQPQEASDQADVYAQRQMLAATNAKGVLDGKALSLKENFGKAYQQSASVIKQEVDYVVSKMHPDLKPVEGDVNTVLNALPKQYKEHPLAYGYGQLGAIIMAQGRKLAKLMGSEVAAKRIQQDVAKAGPTKTPKARPSSSAKPAGMLSMKDFGID